MFVSTQLLRFLRLTDQEAHNFHRGLAAIHNGVLKIEPRCLDCRPRAGGPGEGCQHDSDWALPQLGH